ncbi:MAG: hypothetical protein SF162_00460 [bacterium]|nr:hypothetical protein [bacterium]
MKPFPDFRVSLFLIGAACALTLWYAAAAGGNFPLDDSWIHQTYGRNLAQHGEWAFVRGQASAASTSPLYTLVLALGYVLVVPFGVDFRVWTHGLGALALGVTAVLAARLAYRMTEHRSAALLIGGAVAACWHLIWAAGSGMETAIFAMLTLAAVETAASARKGTVIGGSVFGMVAALLFLTRPEGILLAALCGAAVLVRLVRARVSAARVVMYLGSAAVTFLVLVTPYLTFNLMVTGGLLPSTAAAKRSQAAALFGLPYVERVSRMILPLLAGGQFLLIPGVVGFIVTTARQTTQRSASQRDEKTEVRWLLIAWGFGLIALYAAWLPLDMQHGRYVMPALPALITAGGVGTLELVRAVRRSALARPVVTTLWLAAAVLTLVFTFTLGLQAYQRDVAIIDGDMVAGAHWLRDNLPADQVLAIHDIGAVGYFAPRPLIDIGGLITPEIVPIIRDGDAVWAYLEAQGAAYLMAYSYQTPNENPDDPRLCPLFVNDNPVTQAAGGSRLTIYRITYTRDCSR